MIESNPHDLDDSLLDRALEAAFDESSGGIGNGASDPAVTVLDRIEKRHGVQTRITLRDASDEQDETIVLPGARPGAQQSKPAGERYQVFGEIARGGMGVILKGRDADLGRDVAIKVLQPELAKQPAMVQRFVEEAQIAGQLQHPGILPVYELGLQDDARPFFSMKLIKGRTLANQLEERADATEDRAAFLKIFEQVCQTVAYAQARGVVHRDLKPSNIMVGAFGEVQVVDWGLAKVLGQGRDDSSVPVQSTKIETVRTESPGSASLAGSVMGTPGYMAPEQARGDVQDIDERTDVYALGAILFEILTGDPPIDRTSRTDRVATAMVLDEPEIIHRLAAGAVDEDLIDLTARCLKERQRDRPRNAKAVADILDRHLVSLEDRAREADVRAAEERTRAEAERHRRKLTLALSSIILLGIILVAVVGASLYLDWRNQVEQRMTQLAAAESEAVEQLGKASAARLDNDEVWETLQGAANRLEVLISAVPPDSELARHAAALLTEIKASARQRRFGNTIDTVVMYSSTHYDLESWQVMERDLRAAMLEFGIDLENMPREEIAQRIREDDATFELAGGLELWLATVGAMIGMGDIRIPMAEFPAWIDTLLDADHDPLRQQVRRFFYAAVLQQPLDRDEFQAMVESLDVNTVNPRTLSWIASILFVLGDVDRGTKFYRRVTSVHPTDFMLIYDGGLSCQGNDRWEEAIRYYLRGVSIRPDVPGTWRQLGVCLRHTGELVESMDAMNRAVELEGDYGPTYVDRAETHLALGDHAAALADAERGMELSDVYDGPGWFVIGRVRLEQADFEAALVAFEAAADAATREPQFTTPLDEWIERCRAELDSPNEGD